MASGFTQSWGALHTKFSPDYFKTLTYPDKPMLGMLKKKEDLSGDSITVPLHWEDPQSVSNTFSDSQNESTSQLSQVAKFVIPPVEIFGTVTVKGMTIRASRTKQGSFFDAMSTAFETIANSVTKRLAIQLYRQGWGDLGRLSDSPGASTTLTLGTSTGGAEPWNVVNFGKGQKLYFSASQSANLLRVSGGGTPVSLEVAKVNRDGTTGTLTMTANLNTISDLAQNDWIFPIGDRQHSATPSRIAFSGIQTTAPPSPPSGNLYGVDVTQDTRIGGTRLTRTGYSIEETLIDGAVELDTQGAKPRFAFMNHSKFGQLLKELEDRKRWIDVSIGKISYRGVEVETDAGTLKVIKDRFCPGNRILVTQWDNFCLETMGALPDFLNHDGLQNLRQSTDDGVEIRIGGYGNLTDKFPGATCNITHA